jgi:hypothetical protein
MAEESRVALQPAGGGSNHLSLPWSVKPSPSTGPGGDELYEFDNVSALACRQYGELWLEAEVIGSEPDG